MQNVHPIFQQALAGIAPPSDAKHWQAMAIQLRTELTQYDAPPCPAGQFAYTHKHPELGAIECHLEGEEADESVGWPEQVTLCDAYLCGRKFTGWLKPEDVEAIELAAVKAPREIEEPA